MGTMTSNQSSVHPDRRCVYLEVRLRCQRCDQPVPVNGLVAVVDCHRCGEHNVLDPKTWSNDFAVDRVASAYADTSKRRFECSWYSPKIDIACGAGEISCPGCRAALGLAGVVSGAPAGGVSCACGQFVRVRAADEAARALHPAAELVVAETPGDGSSRELDQNRSPVVFGCMRCQGALEVNGSSRTVTCSYCSAPNYLPDGLWRDLNPDPVPRRFFLVCAGDRKEHGRAG